MRPCAALLLVSLTAIAQPAPDARAVHINAKTSKPMNDICMQLSDMFHWRITYEDAPVLNPREVAQEASPSGVPWLRMRAVPVSFAIPPKGNETMQEYRRKIMDLAMAAYAGSGNRAAFSYTEDNEYIHVMPRAVAGPDGVLRPTESILNRRVTIPRGKYSLGQIVSIVIAQVGNQIGTTIALATFPTNTFANSSMMEEADNEPAKSVLMRAFDDINNSRYVMGVTAIRMYWDLTYTPEGRLYYFNVSTSDPELDEAMVARRSRLGAHAPIEAGPDGTPARAGFVKIPQ